MATSNECKSDFKLVELGVDVINALNWVAKSIYNLLGAGTGNHPTREASLVAMIYPPLQVSIRCSTLTFRLLSTDPYLWFARFKSQSKSYWVLYLRTLGLETLYMVWKWKYWSSVITYMKNYKQPIISSAMDPFGKKLLYCQLAQYLFVLFR